MFLVLFVLPVVLIFALPQTEDDNQSFSVEAREAVLNNFYVDNCLVLTTREEKDVTLMDQLSELLRNGGFRITKWVCNSEKIMQSIPKSD